MISFRPWMAKILLVYSPVVAILKVITFVSRFLVLSLQLIIADTILLGLTLLGLVATPFAVVNGFAAVTAYSDPLTLNLVGRKKADFFVGLRYNKRVGLTLRLLRVELRCPRCLRIASTIYTPWDGGDVILPKTLEHGELRAIVLAPENATLKTRDRFVWRLVVRRDQRTRFSGTAIPGQLSCTFEFSMAMGLFKSSITENIPLLHPIPIPRAG